jgi:hypothetical protein
MVKYIKSSERSERLAGIQRNREQATADRNTQALDSLKAKLGQFANQYGSRIADLLDTWRQLQQMGEARAFIKSPYGDIIDYGSQYNYDNGWIEIPIEYSGGKTCSYKTGNVYLSKLGLGGRYSIPYGSSVGCFDKYLVYPDTQLGRYADGVFVRNEAQAREVERLIPKASEIFEYLEDYIYKIADRIEE